MPGVVAWLTGCPCAGKTFIGDYLVTQGFEHIDGDGISYSKDPQDVAAWKNMLLAFGHWFKGEVAPPELWQDHYRSICVTAAEASAAGKDVVITFAVYPRLARDFVRTQLKDVQFISLEVGGEELVKRNYARMTKFLEQAGMTHEQYWNSQGDENLAMARAKYGEWSFDAFRKWQLECIYPCIEPFGEDEKLCHRLDNSKLDASAIDQLRSILNLPERKEDVDLKAIEAVNFERYKKIDLDKQ